MFFFAQKGHENPAPAGHAENIPGQEAVLRRVREQGDRQHFVRSGRSAGSAYFHYQPQRRDHQKQRQALLRHDIRVCRPDFPADRSDRFYVYWVS